jgi:hypothetical protein
MKSKKLRLCNHIFNVGFLIFLASFIAAAQIEPNTNSPTPVLISEPNSLRVLATSVSTTDGANLPRIENHAFASNSKVIFYVTNLNLMANEGANAFRIYVEDAKGRKYRFPVLDIKPLEKREWVYSLTVLLKDQLGFWEQPETYGDVLVCVTWRGLASNRLRLGFGKIGGTVKDDTGAVPTPFPNESFKDFKDTTEPDSIGLLYSGDRTRFMEQATFGPTTELDKRIRRIGLRTWLAIQFEAPYPTVPYPDIPLMPTNAPSTCNGNENPNIFPPDPPDIYPECRRDRYTMFPAQNWFFKEAFYGEAQLRHRVAWALSQMWVISGVQTQQSSHLIEYHKVLSRNAFGNYQTLMQEMTLNPGMGNYLDMMRSSKYQPNENFAREILQLFSIGVFMLNQDGSMQLDNNNKPIPTYNQTTVNNFTKVFTGWTTCETAVCPNRTLGAPNYKDPMVLNHSNHDVSAKILLAYPNSVNQNIPAEINGEEELFLALNNIYNHPNVAPFVSRFLIQHLITSDPTPAYVERISTIFNANRTSPTQLKEVVKAILLDPEARGNIKTDPNYGKLREPVQLATNLYRHFGVQSSDGTTESDGWVNPIIAPSGQNAFYSRTVFNYYAPNYVVPGPGINGPEFGLMTTGTAIARTNFINTIVFDRINPGVNSLTGTSINLEETQMLAIVDHSLNQLLDALNIKMMHGTMTAQNKETIRTAVLTVPRTNPRLRAKMAIYLIATSSQYQVQR